MKTLLTLLAVAVVLTGCADTPKQMVTGSLRPARPKAVAAQSGVQMSPEEAKKAACLNRHVQYQKGAAPWGATTPDAIRAGDTYCHDAVAGSTKP